MNVERNKEVYGFLRADGRRLVNGRGEPVVLRGVGFGSWLLPEGYMWRFPQEGDRPRRIEVMVQHLIGAEKAKTFWDTYYNNYIAEEDIATIAEEGFNSVRIPINARFLTGEGPEGRDADKGRLAFDEERLALIDRSIAWCKTYRLYVILDLHGAPGGQTGTNIDDSPFDRPELFSDKSRSEEAVEIWRMLAERYKDEWIVAGYDLLNEPLPEWFSEYNDRVLPLYKEMIAAIREVDKEHMIILEGVHWSTDWSIFEEAFGGSEPIDGNVLLQFHKYWNNPDTESIANYLAYRDKWNVPIFMGEGGENNKDWYAGAFCLFEDHEISWNFWTWKKIDTTNSPCSINKPEQWDRLTAFLQGGEQPEVETAEAILNEYLHNMKLANCEYNSNVVRSLLRQAPLRIPAVFYGYKGEGVSYGFGGGQFEHDETVRGQLSAEKLGQAQHDPEQLAAELPAASHLPNPPAAIGFREGDRSIIAFKESRRETATFAHGGGEEWRADEWLCLRLLEGDWYSYSFYEDIAQRQMAEVTVFLEGKGWDQGGSLSLELDNQQIGVLAAEPGEWRTYGPFSLGIPAPGRHELTLRCTQGSLNASWLVLDRG
ncbi:glycoside hydrolase family 5 protein [Paenibacillus sp. CAU 1782]